jgi:hypothetical protein
MQRVRQLSVIRLCNPIDFGGHHHTGWPWVRRYLRALESDDGLPLDDAVDYSYRAGKHVVAPLREEPWGAIFHQPADFPDWFPGYKTSPSVWMERAEWRRSAPHLVLAVAMCNPLADWLEARLECPVLRLLHPAAPARESFDLERFEARPRVVQLGHHLRNLQAIRQLRPVQGMEYVDVRLKGPVPERRQRAVEEHWKSLGSRVRHPGVSVWSPLDDASYERLLAESVVFVEFLSAAAANVVVECMMRATPLVVNRLPAIEDYLGRDYPLFYDDIADAHRLLDRASLRAGNAYLAGLDKSVLEPERFVTGLEAGLRDAIGSHVR